MQMGNPEQIKALMGQSKKEKGAITTREEFLKMLKTNPSWQAAPAPYDTAPQVIGNNG